MAYENTYLIIRGPSKDELKSALFDGENNQRRIVIFTVVLEGLPDGLPTPEHFVINQIRREELQREGDEQLDFEGYVCDDTGRRLCLATGSYSMHTRKGSVDF